MTAWKNVKFDDNSNIPVGGRVLLKFEDGHIEDATMGIGEDGYWVYELFDGETLNTKPVAWAPIPE